MAANIKEVARRAGVSVGTASNVLNRPDIVAPATRQRVFDAIRELGFVRNESARHLRAGRSRTIGLVVLDVSNPFFTDVARGAEALADEHDCMIVLANSDEDPGREKRHLEQLEEQRVLGLLITPIETSNPHIDQLIERGTPVVLVDRGTTRDQCSVAVDDVLGGRLAGTHLADQGHTRLAFVGGQASIKQVADRLAGFRATAADRTEIIDIAASSLSVAQGRRAGARIADMPAHDRPTAVLCANDLLALGLLQEMTRRGLHVPDDIAIVGYDDIAFAAAAAVPLSSLRQPREQLGRAAMELLLDEADTGAEHVHRQVLFQPELVVRESSSRPI